MYKYEWYLIKVMKTANFVVCLFFIVSWLIPWYFCTVRVIHERVMVF